MPEGASDLLPLVTRIVVAHLANNATAPGDLPPLINGVYAVLRRLGTLSEAALVAERQAAVPAVPANKSIFRDYIVCLEDGRKLQTLKRHLWGSFGLTPEAYRERWGLPGDYPMVAPSYAARRSQIAKATGLGKLGQVSARTSASEEAPAVQRIPEGVRGKKLPRKAA